MESLWQTMSRESKSPAGVLTDEFITKFSKHMDWSLLSENYDFSIEMLRIHQHRIYWHKVLKRMKFNEELLREIASNFTDVCWTVVSQHQKLSMNFMHDYADKLDWELLALYQNMTSEFFNEHNHFSASDEEISEKSSEVSDYEYDSDELPCYDRHWSDDDSDSPPDSVS